MGARGGFLTTTGGELRRRVGGMKGKGMYVLLHSSRLLV